MLQPEAHLLRCRSAMQEAGFPSSTALLGLIGSVGAIGAVGGAGFVDPGCEGLMRFRRPSFMKSAGLPGKLSARSASSNMCAAMITASMSRYFSYPRREVRNQRRMAMSPVVSCKLSFSR